MPKYDKKATYNGQPLSYYTAGLSDLNPQRRIQSLRDVYKFGINGIPAREQIQTMALEDEDHTIRIYALSVLYNMKDPKISDLYEDILTNPEYSDQNKIWADLADGADEMLSEKRLEKVLKKIANQNQEHAEQLLNVSRNAKVRVPLANILLKKEVSGKTFATLMSLLPSLELGDSEKIEFISDNIEKLPNKNAALQAFSSIGGEAALDAVISVVRQDNTIPLQYGLSSITGLARDPETAAKALESLAEMTAEPGRPENDIQQFYAGMERVLDNARNTATSQAGSFDQASYTQLADTYIGHLKDLTQNTSPQVRSLAALYLIQGAGSYKFKESIHPDKALPSVFKLLETDDEEIVLGTIMTQLQSQIASFVIEDSSQLERSITNAIYARDDSDKWFYAVADGLLKTTDSGMATTKLDGMSIIRLISDKAGENPGHATNNRVFDWLLTVGCNKRNNQVLGDDMIEVASRIGKLSLDTAITQQQLEKFFSGSGINPSNLTLATQGHNNAAIQAFAEPMVMSRDPKFTGKSAIYVFKGILDTNIYYLRGDKAQQTEYADWVQTVADNGHPALRMIAINGLNGSKYIATQDAYRTGFAHFMAEIGNTKVKIIPNFYGGKPYWEPAEQLAYASDAIILMRPENRTRLFGRMDNLSGPHAIAFFDARGKIIGVTASNDPNYLKGISLFHPTATGALLIPPGNLNLSIGQILPFESEFIASW